MEKFDRLFIGVFTYTNGLFPLLQEPFEILKKGFFSGTVTMEKTAENVFKFEGTIQDSAGNSKIEGTIIDHVMTFKKTYRNGHFNGQIVDNQLMKLESNFVGSWQNGTLSGKVTCCIVSER